MSNHGGKRKRSERQYAPPEEQHGRPSPHRPENLNLAQQNQRNDRGSSGRARDRRNGSDDRRNMQSSPVKQNQHARSSSLQVTGVDTETTPATNQVAERQDHATPAAISMMREPSPEYNVQSDFHFEYLTSDIIDDFADTGQAALIDALASAQDVDVAGTWLQELFEATLSKRVDAHQAGKSVQAALAKQQGTPLNLVNLLVNLISIGNYLDWPTGRVQTFITATGISADVWRQSLDHEVLVKLGFVRGGKSFQATKAKKMTNLLYRQANYNLLREESEGYAKLMTEYFNTAMTANALDSAPTIAEDAFQRVKALIGQFDLDVGRVLDITLDVFANLLVRNFRFFVKYIRASAWWPTENIPSYILSETHDLPNLPAWALPGANSWGLGSEEAERAEQDRPRKEARDKAFWARVQHDGLDAFDQLCARRITNYDDPAVQDYINSIDLSEPGKERNKDKDELKRKRLNDSKEWMRQTRMLPPSGNPDAAQLLGFKLAYYASPACNDDEHMPDNLIYLTALLIKIGFISLRDIYPHILPSDDAMPEVKTRLSAEAEKLAQDSRPGGAAKNALAMADALPDENATAPIAAIKAIKDDASSSKASSPKPEGSATPKGDAPNPRPREIPDQKILLLRSLLAIGALPEALFILGRFPWIAELVPEITDHIHRIVHHMLGKVYDDIQPLADRQGPSSQRTRIDAADEPSKGTLNRKAAPPRITKRWALIDRPDMGEGSAYKFYWDEWADNVPICQNVDDVFSLCSTLLAITGVKIGRDSALFMKLVRIGKASLANDRSPKNESRWIDLLKRLLVPALSLTSRNPGLVNEVYELLKLFPVATRYSIYAEWHFGAASRLPEVKRAFEYTRAEARDTLKRLSKTNVRAMGKALAKAAYASPGIVLVTAIAQMESYANLIECFVECCRYFTFLGYDVLTWCLLNALGGGSRNRVQADGMLTSAWLQALSTFAGAIFKKYSVCDPAPVLQYIANQLRKGDSTDLELLEQIVREMTGIKSDMTYNDAQVLAMAGGEVMQSQTIMAMGDERHKNEKTTKRLIRSLTDSGLGAQLLIAVAQERQVYSSRDSSKYAPLKVLGNNVDKIHSVMMQFLDTLHSNLSSAAFEAAVPDIVALIKDFGLLPEIAFMIGRGGIASAVAAYDANKKLEQQESLQKSPPTTDAIGDVAMVDVIQAADGAVAMTSVDVKMQDEPKETLATNGAASDSAKIKDDAIDVDPPSKSPNPEAGKFWHPALDELIGSMPALLGEDIASTLSVPFYVMFWTLSLQDIVVNTGSYDQEMANQTALQNKIKADRTDTTTAGTRKREENIKAITETREKLAQEMKKQIGAYTQVRNRLNKEKEHWFQDFHVKGDTLHLSLLQNCFLPRVSVSALDAHYSFMMLKFLHNNGTPGFRTMHLIDRLIRKNQIVALIFSSTALEADNLGRFLNEILKELQGWHADKATYEKSAFGAKRQLPGFARKLNADNTPETFLEYEEFRCLMWKWHSNLNGAFKHCFSSTEYMHICNAILVLKSIHFHFPAVNFMGQGMLDKMQELGKNEKRDDLKLAATSLLGNLKRREKTWVLPQAFRLNDLLQANAKTGASTPIPAAVSTPKKESDAPEAEQSDVAEIKTETTRLSSPPVEAKSAKASPKLNVDAKVFQPLTVPSNSEIPTSADTEDGEIRDSPRTQLPPQLPQVSANQTTDGRPSSLPPKPSPSPAPISILKRPQADRTNSSDRSQETDLRPRINADGQPATRNGSEEPSRNTSAKDAREMPPAASNKSSQPDMAQPASNSRDLETNVRHQARGNTDQRTSSLNTQQNSLRPNQDAARARSGDRSISQSDVQANAQLPPRPARSPERNRAQRGRRAEPDQSSREASMPQGSSNQYDMTGTNPARAALIARDLEASREPERDRPQQGNAQRSSRPMSPRQSDKDRPVQETNKRLDDDQSRTRGAGPRGRGSIAAPPSGPRQDRDDNEGPSDRRSAREAQRSNNDLSRGSQQTLARHQEPSYGRLNAPSTPRQTQGQSGKDQSPSSGPREPPSKPAQPDTNVHPSRLAQLPPIVTKPAPRPTSPRTAGPPPDRNRTGPKADKQPTGPASAGVRSQDRRFANLNDALSSTDRGTSIRGRASRLNSTDMPPPSTVASAAVSEARDGPLPHPSRMRLLSGTPEMQSRNAGEQDRDDERRPRGNGDGPAHGARDGANSGRDRRQVEGSQQSGRHDTRESRIPPSNTQARNAVSGTESREYTRPSDQRYDNQDSSRNASRNASLNMNNESTQSNRGRVRDNSNHEVEYDNHRSGTSGRGGYDQRSGRHSHGNEQSHSDGRHDGQVTRDGRKRRADEMMPGDGKRRRSGRGG